MQIYWGKPLKSARQTDSVERIIYVFHFSLLGCRKFLNEPIIIRERWRDFNS